MSHYTEIKVDFDQKFEKELVAALEEQFGEGGVEVHDTPANMFDWNGNSLNAKNKAHDLYAPPCNLIIRREKQSEAAKRNVLSNDAGYLRTEDGKYKAYVDKAGFSEAQQGKVAQSYTVRVSEKKLKAEGYTVRKIHQPNGTVKLEASIWS